MPRLTFLIIFIVLLMGGLIFLSTQAKEVPTSVIEADVSPAPNAS